MSVLDKLGSPFRDKYLSYDELTAHMQAWAESFSDFVELISIGETPEGRQLWLLKLGSRELDPGRPAAWIDGNMHAMELAGSSVAMAVAEDLIRLHLGESPRELSTAVAQMLESSLVYVLPRMSPDGAEAVLRTGRYVRSVPRDQRANRQHARWRSEDVDGDGLALVMRKEDPTGELVESKEYPGILVERTIDDEGPFYKLYPEGVIENYDGSTVPDPFFLDDNEPDLNRNFPYHWAPEPKQMGAGRFPLSEPESRAVVEFVTAHPNIFAWLNLHCFGGVHIRPLGDKPDAKMDSFDLALFRQIETWAVEHTKYPMVSGFEEFTYEPDTPLHGDLSDFAYYQRGCVSWVCELWDLFEQVGYPKKKRFVDRYVELDREDMVTLAKWDAEHNQSRVVRPWKKAQHPQLGEVEVGGLDPRVGLWNPPYEKLGEVCAGMSELFLRVASLAPALSIVAEVEPLGDGLTKVTATVENRGYLPTYVLGSAKSIPWNEPVHIELIPDGCELIDDADALKSVGHLEGWGQGRWGGSSSLFFQRTKGTKSRAVAHWTVKGSGTLEINAHSCRIGTVRTEVEV